MSDPRDDSAASAASGAVGEQPAARHRTPFLTLPSPGLTRGLRGREGRGLELAGALLLVIALVATGPLWAPLLPWGAATPSGSEATQPRRDASSQPAAPAANPAPQEPDRRIGAPAAKPAAAATDIAELRQQIAGLASTTADLAARVEAVDTAIHSRTASDPTDIAVVLALLQIQDAVEAGRPFAAAYEALVGLARTRPEIAAAAAPLAEPAKTGLAGRPILAERLHELAGVIAAAHASPQSPPGIATAAPGWTDQALARLRGLITIRRIGEPGHDQPEGSAAAAVSAAERALAGGDLEGAVGALGGLAGAPAGAAGPWLRMARERLAAEAALRQLESLLVSRLGAPANAPASSGPSR
ncbi:MAG TPA: hypothetical protein VGS13_02360 [Stellaceae bacterium]|nr:hypothetical protein [Stellaceae bacterium]